jgi:RimJ/RimL family protein N-acetyltransferase
MSWHDKLVPEDFDVPETLEHPRFRLRMLTIHDVDKDLEAIHERVLKDGTPDPWLETTRDENLVDLGWHQKEFESRRSFAYTVVTPDESRVLGCIYLYPDDELDVDVRMWVRRHAWENGLDPELGQAVKDWLEAKWPFERVRFRERD